MFSRLFLTRLIFGLFFSQTVFAADVETQLLMSLCNLQGGQIVQNWTCPNSGKVRSGAFCVVKNQQGQEQVYNGCSHSIGDGGTKFFPACVLHDLCYHNEPQVNHRSKDQCDQMFYENMKSICAKEKDSGSCRTLAWTFYQAVAGFGSSSWSCAKNAVPYTDSMEQLLTGLN